MMKLGINAAIVLCALGIGSAGAAQTIDAGPVEIGFGGRAQVQFNTTSVDEEDLGSFIIPSPDVPFSTFITRRIRVTVSVEIEDWITGRIQPDFALGELSLKDAWLNFALYDALEVRVGQFKKPFSAIELTSTTKYLAIEKGVRIRGLARAFRVRKRQFQTGFIDVNPFEPIQNEHYTLLDGLGYLGRDIGVSVHGSAGSFVYAAGIFNGSGADQADLEGGKSYAGRLEFRPFNEIPLTFGAAASHREATVLAVVTQTPFPAPDESVPIFVDVEGTAFELDAEWGDFRRPGLHVLVEGAAGQNFLDDFRTGEAMPFVPLFNPVLVPPYDNDIPFLAAQGFLAWFQPLDGNRVEGIEPLARVSYGDPGTDQEDDEGLLLTPGANLYFFGRNRLMLNWDVFISANEALDTEHSLRAQVNLHF